MDKKIRAGIVGGAGYTGGELTRLLMYHPSVDIAFIHSRSNAGKKVASIHTDLLGDTDLCFVSEPVDDIDVLFLCTGHSESATFLLSNKVKDQVVIIDLSQDFRLSGFHKLGNRNFVYGLPEVNKQNIVKANSIANPGCFATAIQLALLPLASGRLLKEVHVTGITGATGAGQKLQASSHFAWRANNIQAYKALAHQHEGEIVQTLANMQPCFSGLNFIPWRGDFTRGIYVSAYTEFDKSLEEAYGIYEEYYRKHPFTHVSRSMVDLKQVVNTNKCLLHLELAEGKLVVHAAIDNLLKGASGQAVQNMNLIFGLAETSGLLLKSTSF